MNSDYHQSDKHIFVWAYLAGGSKPLFFLRIPPPAPPPPPPLPSNTVYCPFSDSPSSLRPFGYFVSLVGMRNCVKSILLCYLMIWRTHFCRSLVLKYQKSFMQHCVKFTVVWHGFCVRPTADSTHTNWYPHSTHRDQ